MKATMKTAFLAMAVLLLTTAAAMASPLVGGGDKGGDESMERELESGIHVTFLGNWIHTLGYLLNMGDGNAGAGRRMVSC